MINFFNQPGFLDTHASLRADLALILIVISAIFFTIGWRLAVGKRFVAHQIIQTLAVVLNALVVLLAMVGIFIQQYLPAISGNLNNKTLALIAVHAVAGSLGTLYGIYVMLCGNKLLPRKLCFSNQKTFMRISYGAYILLTIGGIMLYINLYML